MTVKLKFREASVNLVGFLSSSSFATQTGYQYRRSSSPAGVPGPTRVIMSFSSTLSMMGLSTVLEQTFQHLLSTNSTRQQFRIHRDTWRLYQSPEMGVKGRCSVAPGLNSPGSHPLTRCTHCMMIRSLVVRWHRYIFNGTGHSRVW